MHPFAASRSRPAATPTEYLLPAGRREGQVQDRHLCTAGKARSVIPDLLHCRMCCAVIRTERRLSRNVPGHQLLRIIRHHSCFCGDTGVRARPGRRAGGPPGGQDRTSPRDAATQQRHGRRRCPGTLRPPLPRRGSGSRPTAIKIAGESHRQRTRRAGAAAQLTAEASAMRTLGCKHGGSCERDRIYRPASVDLLMLDIRCSTMATISVASVLQASGALRGERAARGGGVVLLRVVLRRKRGCSGGGVFGGRRFHCCGVVALPPRHEAAPATHGAQR